MSTDAWIKGRLRSLEESLERTEADRARLADGIRRARRHLRPADHIPNCRRALTFLDNALAAVDRRRRVE